MIFARKINKMSEFYTIFARKMPELYIVFGRKLFSWILLWEGATPLPPSFTPMAGPQASHQLNPAMRQTVF